MTTCATTKSSSCGRSASPSACVPLCPLVPDCPAPADPRVTRTQLKPKHLDGLTLTLPPPELGTPAQPVGHLSAKKAQYDAFLTVPQSSTKRKRGEAAPEEAEGAGAAAGELAAAVPLVPRKSHGNKLFQGASSLLFPRSHLSTTTLTLAPARPQPLARSRAP